MTTKHIRFPFGAAEEQSIQDAAVPTTLVISNTLTIVKKTGGFTQAVTALSLLAAADLLIGSEVIIRIEQGATGRNVTFGAAGSPIVAPALVGVASDKDTISLIWDGTSFIARNVWQKILDFA
jgi:hypothetical protein